MLTLLPYELAGGMEVTREVIRQIKSGQSVGIFIGPEGGFEPEEVDAAVSMGAKVITWAGGSCGQRQPDLQRLLY